MKAWGKVTKWLAIQIRKETPQISCQNPKLPLKHFSGFNSDSMYMTKGRTQQKLIGKTVCKVNQALSKVFKNPPNLQ